MPLRGAVASVLLRIPLLRHLLQWVGDVDVSARSVRAHLAAGTSVVLVPGGVAEIYETRPDREVLVLRERLGFVRLAHAAGAALVPIYIFGNTSAFRVRPPPPGVADLARRARMSLPSFWGRWGLPLPLRCRVLVAAGAPLPPGPPGEGPEALHARYVEALAALFERHKASAGNGWENKQLIII